MKGSAMKGGAPWKGLLWKGAMEGVGGSVKERYHAPDVGQQVGSTQHIGIHSC